MTFSTVAFGLKATADSRLSAAAFKAFDSKTTDAFCSRSEIGKVRSPSKSCLLITSTHSSTAY